MKTKKQLAPLWVRQNASHVPLPLEDTPAAHTPTPYEIGSGNSREIWAYKRDLNDTLIATCEGIGNLRIDEQRANAAFIVKAVNMHDELRLAILNAMAKICNVHHIESVNEAYAILKNATTKAEGK